MEDLLAELLLKDGHSLTTTPPQKSVRTDAFPITSSIFKNMTGAMPEMAQQWIMGKQKSVSFSKCCEVTSEKACHRTHMAVTPSHGTKEQD